MERVVENTDTAFGASQTSRQVAREPAHELPPSYTPGDFLRQFATVIAICLSLGLLAQFLLPMLGNG